MKLKIKKICVNFILVALSFFVVIGIWAKISESIYKKHEEKLAEQILEIKQDIEQKYEKIEIFYEDWDIKEHDYTYKLSDDTEEIYKALSSIEDILDRLPKNMVEEALDADKGTYAQTYGRKALGINIILCSDIDINDGKNDITVGMTDYNLKTREYNIYLAVGSKKNVGQIFAHELYHFFQRRIVVQNRVKEYYTKAEWQKGLPEGFGYYDETGYSDGRYILENEKSMEDVYFVSSYSKTNAGEDKSEIFSYLLSTDEDKSLPRAYQSTHIKARAKMIIDELDAYYDTVDENAYWNKIFEEKSLNQ